MRKKKDNDERSTRIKETRMSEARRHELEETLRMDWVDPYHIPKHMIPDGMEYGWPRVSVMNQPDNSRLADCMRRGWTPVPADRHPELYFEDPFGRVSSYKGHIYQGGNVLCERPKELGDIERKRIADRNYQSLMNMPGTENFLGEPTMAGNLKNETYLTKAVSFGK